MSESGVQGISLGVISRTLFSSTVATTVANTVTETTLLGAGAGSPLVKANTLVAGSVLRFGLFGLYSTPSLNLATLTARLKLGGVTLAQATLSALLNGAVSTQSSARGDIVIPKIGPNGLMMGFSELNYSVGANTAMITTPANSGGAPVAVDTTQDQLFDLTAQWSAAGSALSIESGVATLSLVLPTS